MNVNYPTVMLSALITPFAMNAVTRAELPPSPPVVAPAEVGEQERAIASVVGTLFAAADAREWNRVAACFADKVQMDYSALGAEAAERTPAQIVDTWKAVLPGFDRTAHNPHNLAVWVVGDRATATCDAIALHELKGDTWTVFTGYAIEFGRAGGAWKIERVRLSLYDEAGDRALNEKAAARVRDGTATPLPAGPTPHAGKVEAFFAALEAGDLERSVGLFAEGGRQVMPFAPKGFPERLEGRDALRKQYAPVARFASQRYPHEVLATADPRVVIAKYDGRITVEPGSDYDNSYVGVWRFDDAGRIAEFTEFVNPNILANGFPGAPPAHYSVHAAGASPADGVALREVRFDSAGDELVGHLFLPPGFDGSRKYPAVVVTGSWTSVKEQMPDEYASRLAKEGFVTLTFDFRGFGESAGAPREFEDSARKTADIRAAVGFLAAHPNVDGDIAGLGVCASSGYMAHAAAQDDRIKHLALVAPWLHDPAMTEELYKERPGGRAALLGLGRAAQAKYDATGEADYDQAVSELNPMAAMYVPGGAFDYYLNPAKAAGPRYANRWAVQSWVPWLTFDAIAAAPQIKVPVHVVHSEQGAVPQGAKAFIAELPGEPATLWLNEFTQEDLYYKPEAVGRAVDATAAWLKEQMK